MFSVIVTAVPILVAVMIAPGASATRAAAATIVATHPGYDDGTPLVCEATRIKNSTATPDFLVVSYLTSAYVQASYRRHGIMTALVTQCQADARHHGLTVLLLSPMTASRRLYERCGFQVAPYLEWETR